MLKPNQQPYLGLSSQNTFTPERRKRRITPYLAVLGTLAVAGVCYFNHANDTADAATVTVDGVSIVNTVVNDDQGLAQLEAVESESTPPDRQPTTKPFRVIVYNVHYPTPAKTTANEIKRLLKMADVVGVNEFAGKRKKKLVAKTVPICDDCEFGGYIPSESNTETALFWNNDRYSMDKKSFKTIKLHPKNTITVKNADGTKSKIKQKTLSFASGNDKTNNEKIGFIVAHNIYRVQGKNGPKKGETDRLRIYAEEREIILNFIDKCQASGLENLVVMGDFNWQVDLDNPIAMEESIVAKGFSSIFQTDVVNETPFVQFTHDSTKRDIDIIFSSKELKMLSREDIENMASDHDALAATIVDKTPS